MEIIEEPRRIVHLMLSEDMQDDIWSVFLDDRIRRTNKQGDLDIIEEPDLLVAGVEGTACLSSERRNHLQFVLLFPDVWNASFDTQ